MVSGLPSFHMPPLPFWRSVDDDSEDELSAGTLSSPSNSLPAKKATKDHHPNKNLNQGCKAPKQAKIQNARRPTAFGRRPETYTDGEKGQMARNARERCIQKWEEVFVKYRNPDADATDVL